MAQFLLMLDGDSHPPDSTTRFPTDLFDYARAPCETALISSPGAQETLLDQPPGRPRAYPSIFEKPWPLYAAPPQSPVYQKIGAVPPKRQDIVCR
jgi:hypothetical protein